MPNILDHKIQHSAPGSKSISANANALIGHKPNTHGSFAQQLTQMRNAAAGEREAFNPNKLFQEETQLQDQVNTNISNSNSTQKQQAAALFAPDFTQDAKQEQELKEIRDHEIDKELKQHRNAEEASKDAKEIDRKFGKSSETQVADAGQLNHKQVTEAMREGNVAQQDAPNNNDSGSRKKQLENWEDLAPKIVEDPINRAVRIDIPGLNDIETLIVRMNPSGVGIQAVGSKDAMSRLMSSESELAKKLREHNITLDSLKAFDGNVLRKGKA